MARVFSADKGPTLAGVAELIRSGKSENIVFAVGAGISTSCGIPDFRSPGTGLYSNLKQYDLEQPEDIFSIDYFRRNPKPFHTLAQELFPGKYLPSLTHYFFQLVDQKGLLRRVFTQNIDTLERATGLDGEKVVEAHGSFAAAHCLQCHREVEIDLVEREIRAGRIARCNTTQTKQARSCQGLVKPDIVFFGEGLPTRFFRLLKTDLEKTDLLIVIGTSLCVSPFNSIIDRVSQDTPRVLINLEPVALASTTLDDGDGVASFFSRMMGMGRGFDFEGSSRGGRAHARDVGYFGDADQGIKELAVELGWWIELQDLFTRSRYALAKKWGVPYQGSHFDQERTLAQLGKEMGAISETGDDGKNAGPDPDGLLAVQEKLQGLEVTDKVAGADLKVGNGLAPAPKQEKPDNDTSSPSSPSHRL